MDIGIIGTGDGGSAPAVGLTAAGHETAVGSRDPEANGSEGVEVDTAGTLASDLGFEPVVAGDLAAASHLEHLARFWIHLSREYGCDIVFRLLREAAPGG